MPARLLSIIELGGYPDFTTLYERCGFEVVTVYAMRKALPLCEQLQPDVVVTEFKYGPVYGSRISNLESLFAALQCHCPNTRLVILLDKEEQMHLQRLHGVFPITAELTFPIDVKSLEQAVSA